MIADNNLLLPDELERRQMFHLLKKHSSWTAWNRILGYYQKWADITEESVRQADNNGLLPKTVHPPGYTTPPGVKEDMGQTSIYYRDYVKVTQGLALFDEGVKRLVRGDKRVFNADEANDFFGRSLDCTSHYQWAKRKLEDGEISWKETTPLMKEFFESLSELLDAWYECAHDILEPSPDPRWPDAPNVAKVSYYLTHMIFLPQLPYPKPLPEIPEIYELMEIETGEDVPFSGIWEPVKGSTHIGAMNYLHGGREAPQLEQIYRDITELDYGYASTTIDVTWRLIWRDNRYEDGTIPEEERDYRFIDPCPHDENYPGGDPFKYLERHNLQNPLLAGVRPESETGK